MSSSTPAARPLASGRYFGSVRLREEHSGFALTDLRHGIGRRLPLHGHERAYFCLLRSGGYAERYGRHQITYAAHSVLFHPPGIVHRDEIAPGGASFLIVEIGDDLYRRATQWGALGGSRQDLRCGELSQAATRLEREWRDPSRRSPLVLEGLVLEMLGILARSSDRIETSEPPWLAAVLERLQGELHGPLTIEELARAAGVHPVRLSRVFRRQMGIGIGEYLRNLRVRRVEERLRDPGVALAELALEVGFVDQSHMTRVFRQVTGRTPGSMRRSGRERG